MICADNETNGPLEKFDTSDEEALGNALSNALDKYTHPDLEDDEPVNNDVGTAGHKPVETPASSSQEATASSIADETTDSTNAQNASLNVASAPTAGVVAEDRRSASNSEIPADLAGTAQPVPAANDDQQSTVSDLVYALQNKPRSMTGWLSLGLGIAWIAGCVFYGFANLGTEISAVKSFGDISNSPKILLLIAALILPLLVLWAFASMIRRAQEMRHAANSMTEAAIRLLQPEEIATGSVNTLGRAIRREVAAIGGRR